LVFGGGSAEITLSPRRPPRLGGGGAVGLSMKKYAFQLPDDRISAYIGNS
jgi:hypothetical protein